MLLLYIIFVSAGNLQSQASRSPHKGTVAWDLQSSKHSPIKMVGTATSVPSSQTSPALVNALFERVEEQAEVSAQTYCIKKNLTRCTILTAAVLLWNKNKNNNSNNTINFSQITFIYFNTSLLFNVYNMLARMVINLPSQAIPWIVNGDLLSSTNDF